MGGGGYPGAGVAAGTDLYDSVLLGSDEIMRKQSGHKALVILSDGVDTGRKVPLSSCIESAQREDTLVYSILFEDPEAYAGGRGGGYVGMGRRGRFPMPAPNAGHADGRKVLEQISRETGGRFFRVSKKDPLSTVYAEIDEDLRQQYSNGYSSDSPAADNHIFRHIHLSARQKGLTVTTGEGYYPSAT